MNSGVRERQGVVCPPEIFHWKILADLPGKEKQGKNGKWSTKGGKL